MVFTYFVTGTNRGIGLALVKELTKKEDVKIIATARNPAQATELKKVAESTGKVVIVELDVGSEDSIAKLDAQLSKVASDGIDFYIGNAGYSNPTSKVIDCPAEEWLKSYKINTLGQVLTFKAVYPYLLKRETRKVAFVSSEVGSLSAFLPATWSAYGQSKAALNYTMLELDFELKNEGFTIISCSPGLVETDLFRGDQEGFEKLNPELAVLREAWVASPEESALLQVKNVYDVLTPEKSGKFFSREGKENPF